MQVAIQGEYGSFSHQAALQMVPQATILPCAYSAEVFARVVQDHVAAVIPIENSLAGSVVEHFDLLSQNDVRIDAESLLRIRHNLIGIPGSTPDCIRRVASHPRL
jgi:prephenate dehydratase